MPSDAAPLSAEEDRLWRNLGRVVHVLPRLLEEDMSRTGVTATEFAVLSLLNQAPEQRMRMSDLAAAAGLTPSRITRLIDSLAAHGLVTKERHGRDARGNEAILTADGARATDSAAPTHAASARRRVLANIPSEAVPELARVLENLAEGLTTARNAETER